VTVVLEEVQEPPYRRLARHLSDLAVGIIPVSMVLGDLADGPTSTSCARIVRACSPKTSTRLSPTRPP
jgi:hypothetical protein